MKRESNNQNPEKVIKHLQLPRKAYPGRRGLFFCFLALSIMCITTGLQQPAAAQQKQQAGWQVQVEEGGKTNAILNISNRCLEPHNFRVRNKIKYLSFTQPTESILIAPGVSRPLTAIINAAGLKPRIYEDDLLVECLDCKKEKASRCTQDRDKVPVQLTVNPAANFKVKLPTATCFCVISILDLTNQKHRDGVIMDLTGAVNKTYSGLNPQNDTNQTDCNTRCTTEAAKYTGSQSVAAAACAAGTANGTVIRAWSAVGTREYKSAQQIGILINTPEVKKTVCTCPATWWSDKNVPGGVTTDGKCKKEALDNCGIKISPLPPMGTQLGTWGFSWDNTLWAYGTKENGGAANCVTTVVSPAVCKFQ